MKKDNKNVGHDTDKAMAKAGTVSPKKYESPETEEPIAEKDEVKKAEDELRERMHKKYAKE